MANFPVQIQNIHLSIVCPMANEAGTAIKFVEDVLSFCDSFRAVDFFVVLDGVSKDNTLELLQNYAAREPRLKAVWAPENRCVVDAYVRGYREAIASKADWILEIDAGFSHRPSDLPLFFETMAKGYDCVFATRFEKGGKIEESSFKRNLVSRGGTVLANLLLSTNLSDMTSGFQLFKREILEKIFSQGHFFQRSILPDRNESLLRPNKLCGGSDYLLNGKPLGRLRLHSGILTAAPPVVQLETSGNA